MLDGNTAALRQHQALADAADRVPLDLKRAREELIEKLLSGDKVQGTWLRTVLESELDRNYVATVHHLAEDLSGIGELGDYAMVERISRITTALRGMVEFYLDHSNPQLVRDYAEELAGEDLDDAS